MRRNQVKKTKKKKSAARCNFQAEQKILALAGGEHNVEQIKGGEGIDEKKCAADNENAVSEVNEIINKNLRKTGLNGLYQLEFQDLYRVLQ